MASMTIDGKQCSFEGKQTILQVALDHGIEIPHYCYHPGLSIVASCRICLAEVAAPNPRNEGKVELMPKLVPTCQTMASENMVVDTQSPKSIANQKAVMEYLLINHPLDCPVCDQAGECSLQDYSYKYGRAASRFEEDKIKQPKKDLGPNVWLYSDRCIMCSRCVRFTREVSGTNEIGVFGRGANEEIDVFPGRPLDNELSANVVDICPVGALLDKDFLFQQRVWLLSRTPSVDGITASGDNIYVEHNEGKVWRIKPRENMDVNKWWISDEIRYSWKFVHAEDRLISPVRDKFGDRMETDWADALDAAAESLKGAIAGAKQSAGSLLLMVSPMLPSEEAFELARTARRFDPEARLAVGPVPVDGEDKSFPGGYTVRAEKAPNARGVRHALEAVGGDVLDYAAAVELLGDKAGGVEAMLVAGGYPSDWADPDLVKAVGRRTLVLIDLFAGALSKKATVVLPGAAWVEKAGSFENVDGLHQAFDAAIPPVEFARPEGQVALDLAVAAGFTTASRFDAHAVRAEMGEPFASASVPTEGETKQMDMVYVEL